ncbi:MAG: 3-deoxy-D-manno-octulosonic acid transferase [Nitrospirae bacterium]|nr:MAG: 3-deoxy-D-manno-octulosonic acid transferase [Nitrospirota bacterium]
MMGYVLYQILVIGCAPFIILSLLCKKRCRRGLLQRLGLRLPNIPAPGQPVLWVHAVSFGEVATVAPLVRALHDRYPAASVLVSTITETGREAVERHLAGIATHCYLPVDWPWAINRLIRHLHPAGFLLVETELWPNLLRVLRRHDVPAVLVNGRLSSRSFQWYCLVRPFFHRVLSCLTLCLVQSERDRHRFLRLGVPPERVYRTGNMKFDQSAMLSEGLEPSITLHMLGVQPSERLIVAGSTHEGEEEALLRCYKALLRSFPRAILLLAPRHIERTQQVEAMVQRYGLTPLRRSQLSAFPIDKHIGQPRVIVLDSRGELAQIYGLAYVTFVGGTLVPIGGHNLLEPARWGKPVFFGPFTDHCLDIAELLTKEGGGVQVAGEADLLPLLVKAFHDHAWVETMGKAAQQLVHAHRGVVERNMHYLSILLDPLLKDRARP